MKVVMPLADGFEETEAIVPIDVLRRAGVDVITVYINTKTVMGAHSIPVEADASIDDINTSEVDAVVCPGGMPGSDNLMNDERVVDLIKTVYNNGKYAAAICAAPRALFKAGVLQNKKATCFPGTEKLFDSTVTHVTDPVVVDGRVITGIGAGAAYGFAFALISTFFDKDKAEQLKKRMLYTA